jgi:hypothetical protein
LHDWEAADIFPEELDQSELAEDSNHFLVIRLIDHHKAKKAHDGVPIPLRDVKKFGMEKEPLIKLPASANVRYAVVSFLG